MSRSSMTPPTPGRQNGLVVECIMNPVIGQPSGFRFVLPPISESFCLRVRAAIHNIQVDNVGERTPLVPGGCDYYQDDATIIFMVQQFPRVVLSHCLVENQCPPGKACKYETELNGFVTTGQFPFWIGLPPQSPICTIQIDMKLELQVNLSYGCCVTASKGDDGDKFVPPPDPNPIIHDRGIP